MRFSMYEMKSISLGVQKSPSYPIRGNLIHNKSRIKLSYKLVLHTLTHSIRGVVVNSHISFGSKITQESY